MSRERLEILAAEATPEERVVALGNLAVVGARALAADTAEPSLLTMDRPTMIGVGRQRAAQAGLAARQAHAVLWLADQLEPQWGPWPSQPLSNILKPQPHKRNAYLAREMHGVGMHDLCNHEDDGGQPNP
jgi:hypothetical protein